MENWMHVNVWNLIGILKSRVPTCPPNISPKKSPGISGRIPSIFFGCIHTNDRIFPFFHAKNRPPPICLPPSLRATFRHYRGTPKHGFRPCLLRNQKKTAAAVAPPALLVVRESPGKSYLQSWWGNPSENREGRKSRNLRFVGKPWKTYSNFNKGGISGICFFRIWCRISDVVSWDLNT